MENRRIIIIAFLMAGLLAAGVALLFNNPGVISSPNGGWARFGVVIAVVVGIVLFVITLSVRAARTRREAWREKADALGDAIDLDFDHDPPKNFHHDYLFLPEIKKSGKTNRIARGTIAGREALFFEHSYVVSTGQTTYTIYHCVYSTDAPNWPEFSVTPRSGLSKLLRKLGRRKGLLLDDPKFNQAFVVGCEDEPFAVTILTPMMQAFMLEKPKARWRCLQGRMYLIYSGALKLDRMPASVDRLERFWKLVPRDVEAWERRGMI